MTELHRRPPAAPPNGPGTSEDGADPAAAAAESLGEPEGAGQYAARCAESPSFAQLGLAGEAKVAPEKRDPDKPRAERPR